MEAMKTNCVVFTQSIQQEANASTVITLGTKELIQSLSQLGSTT